MISTVSTSIRTRQTSEMVCWAMVILQTGCLRSREEKTPPKLSVSRALALAPCAELSHSALCCQTPTLPAVPWRPCRVDPQACICHFPGSQGSLRLETISVWAQDGAIEFHSGLAQPRVRSFFDSEETEAGAPPWPFFLLPSFRGLAWAEAISGRCQPPA